MTVFININVAVDFCVRALYDQICAYPRFINEALRAVIEKVKLATDLHKQQHKHAMSIQVIFMVVC